MWQYVAVCCNVLQCVAVCCSVSQCVAVCGSVWQYVAVCGSVCVCSADGDKRLFRLGVVEHLNIVLLQCVAVCRSVLQ